MQRRVVVVPLAIVAALLVCSSSGASVYNGNPLDSDVARTGTAAPSATIALEIRMSTASASRASPWRGAF